MDVERRHALGALKRSVVLTVAVLAAVAPAASAQASRQRRAARRTVPRGLVFRSGAWMVRRAVDAKTGTPSCRVEPARTGRIVHEAVAGGVPDTVEQVALSAGPNGYVFTINLQKSLSAYSLRFGNEPPLPTQLATDRERSLAAIAIQGEDFLHLLAVTRLRVHVLQRESGRVTTEDIDLRGLAKAFQFGQTSAKCQAGH